MKNIISALVAALALVWIGAPTTASAQQKPYVMGGVGDTAAYFFAPDELETNGNIRRARIYGVLANGPSLDNRQARFTTEYMEFDCGTKNRSRHLTLAAYDSNWGLIAESNEADAWEVRAAGSVAIDLVVAICDYPKLIAENATFNAERRTLSETVFRVLTEPN